MRKGISIRNRDWRSFKAAPAKPVSGLSLSQQSAIKAGAGTGQGVRKIQLSIRYAVGGKRNPGHKVGGGLDDMIPVRQSRHFQVEESGFSSRLHGDDRRLRGVKFLGAVDVIRCQIVQVRHNTVHYCADGLPCLIWVVEAENVPELVKRDAVEIPE